MPSVFEEHQLRMGKVVHLPTKSIPPKSETHEHAGQRYTITYDPNAKTYVWKVNYVRVLPFFGEGSTYHGASVLARKLIHKMNMDSAYWEEQSE